MVGITPSCRAPAMGSRAACAASTNSSAPWSSSLALSASSAPMAVGITTRLVRSSNFTPSMSSSSWIAALRVDWLTRQSAAAALKWRRSTTETRKRSWRKVGRGAIGAIIIEKNDK